MSARRREPSDEVMGHTTRGSAWEWKQSWFMIFFLTVYLYWVPLVYMGLRVLQFRWIFYGVLYAAPGALYLLVDHMGAPLDTGDGSAADLHEAALRHTRNGATAFAIFAVLHTLLARGEFLVRLAEQQFESEELRERARGRANPASEEGIPDAQAIQTGLQARLQEQAEAEAAGIPLRRLLSVNGASETELAMLPGFGPERARQAARLREDMGEYRSFADFAGKMQLAPDLRARLRPLFEPDSEEVALAVPKDDPAYRLLPDGTRVLEINWASAEALGALPGLGPALAQRAVALRDGDGPFKSLEDFRYRLSLSMDKMIKISPYVSVISMSTRPGGGDKKTGGRIVDV